MARLCRQPGPAANANLKPAAGLCTHKLGTSAFRPNADMSRTSGDVGFVPDKRHFALPRSRSRFADHDKQTSPASLPRRSAEIAGCEVPQRPFVAQ
jgi:hypothetical protein